MKTLFWCLSFLVLVAMAAVQVDSRLCKKTDVDEMMLTGTGGNLEIGMEVVKKFGPCSTSRDKNPFDGILDQGQKTQIMERIQPYGPEIMAKSGHHIIPFNLISQELNNMERNIRTDPKYTKVREGLHRLIGTGRYNNLKKSKTWHAAIKKLKQDKEVECSRGGIELSKAIQDVADELAGMVCWTPNNIFVGPSGRDRAGEPGDNTDNEILQTFTTGQQKKFKKKKEFSYEVNKWYTILELLAEIDNGPGIWGPTWEKLSSPPNRRYPQQLWIVKKKTPKKICSVDLINTGPKEKCQAYTPYVGITDGKLICRDGVHEGITKNFRSLCT